MQLSEILLNRKIMNRIINLGSKSVLFVSVFIKKNKKVYILNKITNNHIVYNIKNSFNKFISDGKL